MERGLADYSRSVMFMLVLGLSLMGYWVFLRPHFKRLNIAIVILILLLIAFLIFK